MKHVKKANKAGGAKGKVREIKQLRKTMMQHAAALRDYGDLPPCSS